MILTGQTLVITAGLLDQSWSITLTGLMAMPFIAYHMNIERKRLKVKRIKDLWRIWEKT